MKSNLKLFCLCLAAMGVLLCSQQVLAFQINSITGYVHADGFDSSAYDEQFYDGFDSNTFILGSAYSPVSGLDFSLASGFDVFELGNFSWTVTNGTGSTLTNTSFFSLLDATISFGSDNASNDGLDLAGEFRPDSWEIDTLDGDITSNLNDGSLDNTGSVFEYDALLAIGFEIGTLLDGQSFTTAFTLSDSPFGLLLDGYGDFGPESVWYDGRIVSGTSGGPAPVPEPGTFLLLGAGLCGLGFLQRRRKNEAR